MLELSLPERLYQENPIAYERVSADVFKEHHQLFPHFCVDGFLMLPNGVLLVKRRENPARGLWWPIGGKVPRELGSDDAIKKIAKRESGLDVEIVSRLGWDDTFFDDSPEWMGHDKGTDTRNGFMH
ncbi:MAG: NUDIX domain-containing protein [Nanoarchaeota archaeon]